MGKLNKNSKLERLRLESLKLGVVLYAVSAVIAVEGLRYGTNNDVCHQANPYEFPLFIGLAISELLVYWNIDLDSKKSNLGKWLLLAAFIIVGAIGFISVQVNGRVLCNLTF